MKTKETLYTTIYNNIGQVRIENAQKEIERLNRQYNINSWRTDNSPFMFVEDETDDDVHNPCELIEGYVWVTCEPSENYFLNTILKPLKRKPCLIKLNS